MKVRCSGESMTKTANAFEIIGESRPGRLVVTCDHASNRVPAEIGNGSLGLPLADMNRHIAYDVGAAGVSRHLGALLQAPVILSRFSRLVVDPNRGEDDPTLFMQLYDGTIIPGNRHLGERDRALRLDRYYHPYHHAVSALLARRENPVIVAVHSFTRQINGNAERPWHVGVLHTADQRLSDPMLLRLRQQPDLCIGDNEPYGGHLVGDSIDRHATPLGHANVLIELRNDLIRTGAQQENWAARLAPIIADVVSAEPAE